MSTAIEVQHDFSEKNYLSTQEIESNGIGAVYGLLSNQLEYVGVYQGVVDGAHRFSGIKIEERMQYGVAALKSGFDNHNQDDQITHNDGAKPAIMIGHNTELATASKRDFTGQLVPLVVDYLRQLKQNPDIPRRIDNEDLDTKLNLFERIDQGIKNGSLVVDEDGNCNIYSLFEARA